MTGCIKNQYYRMDIDANGKKAFYGTKKGKLLFTLSPLYEFALQIECEEYAGVITSHLCQKKTFASENLCGAVYEHALFEMEVRYTMEEAAVRKELCMTARTDLTLRYAQTENSAASLPLSRGGEGQPVFLGEKAFVSVIFPAAQNQIDRQTIRLEQTPYVTLSRGERFEFFPVVYGFAAGETVEESFLQYIEAHKKQTPKGLRIYSDWGAHDELAKEAELDEAMALRLLKNLQRARELGVTFDYYLMDAQWFEEKDLYRSFRKRKWPEGQGRFLEELKKMKMEFGLWFDVNMGMLNPPAEAVRYDKNNGHTCLGYEENAKLLFDGIEAQISQSGCTMLKLDFAFFDCQEESHTAHASGMVSAKEPQIRNFLKGLAKLYEKNPKLIVLGYNGFTTNLQHICSVDPNRQGQPISPWWCLYLDYLYCGDPRPSEISTIPMGKSLIYYTDSMIRNFRESLMPYGAIDDHGTMVGETNTIYYLGKGNFQDSWIMNISRGSGRTLLYGELELFKEEDGLFVKESQKLFAFTCREDVVTEAVPGDPRLAEPYGYNNGNGKEGYLTLVNPGNQPVRVNLSEYLQGDVELRKWYTEDECRTSESGEAYEKTSEIRLMPHEITVFQWRQAESVPITGEGFLVLEKGTLQTLPLSFGCRGFSLELADENGTPLRLFGREKQPVLVEGFCPETKISPADFKPVWSGCSWAVYRITADSEKAPKAQLRNVSDRCLYIRYKEN